MIEVEWIMLETQVETDAQTRRRRMQPSASPGRSPRGPGRSGLPGRRVVRRLWRDRGEAVNTLVFAVVALAVAAAFLGATLGRL